MKTISREYMEENDYLDGVLVATNRRKRTIYSRAGKEVVRYGRGFREIRRDRFGVAILEVFAKTIQPINIFDVMKQVRESGGSVFTSNSQRGANCEREVQMSNVSRRR